ncbi:MAG: hypothetical protein LBQ38_09165 [Spirochaetaceae bacterium]|jgi:hypothetical protein|nr:hypothetical protein [Spirochaetaceae bacterium]
MKKHPGVLFLFAVLTGTLAAQTVQSGPGAVPFPGAQGIPQGASVPETAELRNFYYHVVSDGGSADAAALARELELRFNVFNRLFRFDAASLASPLKVRAFKDKEAYDTYVSARLGSSREGAVYLHYNQRERRELVIHRGSPEESRSLSYQAFVQFIRGFIANPPAWLRDGFAVYFSTITYNSASGELAYEENLSWLETVKNLGDAAPAPEAVFEADIRGFPSHFQAMAWSLVSFFLNSGNEDYFRTMTELFMVLSETDGARENAEVVFRRIQRHDSAAFRKDYLAYLASRKTFGELIREGQNAYALQDLPAAEQRFIDALNQKPANPVPYYYLGLLAYEKHNYDLAENYYRSALQYGADDALVRYALGVNAASAGRFAEAKGYLEQAAAASPERYKSRVEGILLNLP